MVFAYLFGWTEEVKVPSEKTKRCRHEMLKQIKNSNLKLKSIIPAAPVIPAALPRRKRRRSRKTRSI